MGVGRVGSRPMSKISGPEFRVNIKLRPVVSLHSWVGLGWVKIGLDPRPTLQCPDIYKTYSIIISYIVQYRTVCQKLRHKFA